MTRFLLIPILILVMSCNSAKNTSAVGKSNSKYEIVQRPFVQNGDTTYINELRFYNVASATDIQVALFNAYGKWDQAYEGKYNPGIAQLVWEKCALFASDELFMLITDGEESQEEYFSSVMVFDNRGNDLLTSANPDLDILVGRFIELIKNRGSREGFPTSYRP